MIRAIRGGGVVASWGLGNQRHIPQWYVAYFKLIIGVIYLMIIFFLIEI